MMKNKLYEVVESIGKFADEAAFKKKYMSMIDKMPDRYKTVLAIENTVEPGMPDLIVVDSRGRSFFIEIKYARNSVITFKKSQLPWYRRHTNLPIAVIAYNDKTENLHLIAANYLLTKMDSVTFRLEREAEYEIKEHL